MSDTLTAIVVVGGGARYLGAIGAHSASEKFAQGNTNSVVLSLQDVLHRLHVLKTKLKNLQEEKVTK